MKKNITIGCSSYNNRYWKGIFYPEDLPSAKWFEYYCQHFDTFEINATFYKFPTLRIMENWYKKAPENFRYAVKAPKLITHTKKFIDCETQLAEFYHACSAGLKEKLGYVLFQFPPGFHYDSEKLKNIIANLNPRFKNVLEFRHESWWITEVWNLLSKNNITFCSVNYPNLPSTIFSSDAVVYVRLHGKPQLFYSPYTTAELTDLAEELNNSKQTQKAVVYFNNTASTAGILNALELKQICTTN